MVPTGKSWFRVCVCVCVACVRACVRAYVRARFSFTLAEPGPGVLLLLLLLLPVSGRRICFLLLLFAFLLVAFPLLFFAFPLLFFAFPLLFLCGSLLCLCFSFAFPLFFLFCIFSFLFGGSLWDHVGVILGSFWGHFGIILVFGEPLLGFGGTQKTSWGTLGPSEEYAFPQKTVRTPSGKPG